MSAFQMLVLQGLWIIVRLLLKTQNDNSGTDEVMWAKGVAETLQDERYRNL